MNSQNFSGFGSFARARKSLFGHINIVVRVEVGIDAAVILIVAPESKPYEVSKDFSRRFVTKCVRWVNPSQEWIIYTSATKNKTARRILYIIVLLWRSWCKSGSNEKSGANAPHTLRMTIIL